MLEYDRGTRRNQYKVSFTLLLKTWKIQFYNKANLFLKYALQTNFIFKSVFLDTISNTSL